VRSFFAVLFMFLREGVVAAFCIGCHTPPPRLTKKTSQIAAAVSYLRNLIFKLEKNM